MHVDFAFKMRVVFNAIDGLALQAAVTMSSHY